MRLPKGGLELATTCGGVFVESHCFLKISIELERVQIVENEKKCFLFEYKV